MATIAALSAAIIDFLGEKLTPQVAKEFNISADEFAPFLKEFLHEQLEISAERKVKNTRPNGYNLFCTEAKNKDKSLTIAKIRELWKGLSNAEKQGWKEKSQKEPQPSKKSTTKEEENPHFNLFRNAERKRWMVEGTEYFVDDCRKKAIAGKFVNEMETPLTREERIELSQKGWKLV